MVRWKALIGTVALGVVVSSCSTTREEVKESTLEVATPSSNEGLVVDERLSAENAALLNKLHNNMSEITTLRKKIALNDSELLELNKKLTAQEEKLAQLTLQNEDSNAILLKSLEKEKTIRIDLEKRYFSLKLKNSELREKLDVLTSENAKLENVVTTFKVTPEVVKTIESECTAASRHSKEVTVETVDSTETKVAEQNTTDTVVENCDVAKESPSEYENVLNLQALNNEYAQTVLELGKKQTELTAQYDLLNNRHQELDQQHTKLKQENSNLRDVYTKIKQKNLDLGGAIADSRAQHQILWDRISVQDKIIADLQADANLLSKEPTFQLSHASTNPSSLNNEDDASNIPTVIEQSTFDSDSLSKTNSLIKENALLKSEIAKLKQGLVKQQALLSKFQQQSQVLFEEKNVNDNSTEQLATLQRDLEKLSEMNRIADLSLAAVRSELDLSKAKESKLNQELDALKTQLPVVRAELESLERREQTLAAEKLILEKQINSLIPFEAEVNALENQLKSNIRNVQWQRPTAMPLNSAFEVIVTAEVDNVVSGQVYVAELVVDTSFDLISAAEAESIVEDGKLIWRWRISGLNEQRAARVDLFVHQQIQYHDQRFSRQVYRDQTLVTLEDDDFWEEYGFWGLAIFAGLLGGFFVGRVGKGKE